MMASFPSEVFPGRVHDRWCGAGVAGPERSCVKVTAPLLLSGLGPPQTSGRRKVLVVSLGLDRHHFRACDALGWEVVAVCGRRAWDALGPEDPLPARVLVVESHRAVDDVLAALTRHDIDSAAAVITSDENALVAAAVVAGSLGAAAADLPVTLRLRDKSLQKRAVAAAGVRTAAHQVLECRGSYDAADLWSRIGPGVLKPVAGVGTRDTSLVADEVALRSALAGLTTRDGTWIYEAFDPSPVELVADGVVVDGSLRHVSLGRYGDTCLATVAAGRDVDLFRLDPERDRALHERVVPVIEASLAGLGLTAGVFHMELFHDPVDGRVSFSECAGRRGGGLTVEQVLRKDGVDLATAHVEALLGHEPRLASVPREDTVGAIHVGVEPGTVRAMPPVADAMELPGVELVRHVVEPGARFDAVRATSDRVAEVLLVGRDLEEWRRRAGTVRTWYQDRTLVSR